MKFLPATEQLKRLKDAVEPVDIVSEDELIAKLEKSRTTGKPLRIKQGFDASAPDLHVGHAVSLWKLKAFQDLGHTVIFLIGDFTGMVGDPSGKSKTRPTLTRQQVEINAQTYKDQVFKILDPQKTEVRFNSEWHAARNIYDFLDLCSRFTVRRMLERDDFSKRFTEEQPISMLEFLYPLIQAYDSVALAADVELGGSDQRFNLLITRQIQRSFNQEEQVVFLMPLLRGTDGNDKMSKSLHNAVGIDDDPNDMFGKIMSISDELLEEYYVMGLFRPLPDGDPYQLKHDLALGIVERYWGSDAAEEAQNMFIARFSKQSWPTLEELCNCNNAIKIDQETEYLPRIMVTAGAANSNGEAMRLIKAGAVEIDGNKIKPDDNLDIAIQKPRIIKVGKRKFFAVYCRDEQLALSK